MWEKIYLEQKEENETKKQKYLIYQEMDGAGDHHVNWKRGRHRKQIMTFTFSFSIWMWKMTGNQKQTFQKKTFVQIGVQVWEGG